MRDPTPLLPAPARSGPIRGTRGLVTRDEGTVWIAEVAAERRPLLGWIAEAGAERRPLLGCPWVSGSGVGANSSPDR